MNTYLLRNSLALTAVVVLAGCGRPAIDSNPAVTSAQSDVDSLRKQLQAAEAALSQAKSELATAHNNAARLRKELDASEQHWRDWATNHAEKRAQTLAAELIAGAEDEQELAIQLAMMNQQERSQFNSALERMRSGEKLRPNDIRLLSQIPIIRNELGAAALMQERAREFSELFPPPE